MKNQNIFIIGDSVGAGIGFKGERTWGTMLGEHYGFNVINKSVGGGTVGSSIRSLEKTKNIRQDDTIIIEVGGNDLLGRTELPKFREDLSQLLAAASLRTSTLMMLELPLPPFHGGYGRVQRELSARYHVLLIPKCYFSAVFSGGDATVDGLQLANPGHQKMADMIANHLKASGR